MEPGKIRNIALVSQSGSGKTSLAEAMLFVAKATTRLGKVDNGTSVMDFEPEETKRNISISTSFHDLGWKKNSIYLLDNPGEDNFLAEALTALRVADNCLFVLDATDPVKAQTPKVWEIIRETGLPVMIAANKLDRERADFNKALETFRDTFDVRLVPVALPIGKEENFSGVVDLVHMKAFTFDKDGKAEPAEIPAGMADEVEEARNNLIEYAAESNDDLLEKFLEGEELSPDEVVAGLKQGILDGGFIPVTCTSATNLTGVATLLDFIVQLMASPEDRGAVEAGDEMCEPDPSAPLAALVFKTLSDPYAGQLSIMRIFSGTLQSDNSVYNSTRDENEKFGQIFLLRGKEQKAVDKAGPGEVVAIAKLKHTRTGDTICSKDKPVRFDFVETPSPVLTYALKPRSRGDEEKIANALAKLQEEDSTITVARDQQTHEILLSGQGQIHIDVIVEKLERKFNVNVDLTVPQIAYLETIKGSRKGVIYRHKKQTGGAGQFAEVHFDITPLPRGGGFEFEEALVGMNVPRNFVPAVEKGLHEAMASGPLAGFPVADIKVRFYDGKSHEVDSNEMAFKIAAIQCFKKGILDAKPTLLEPVVKMTVTVPDENVGDIIGDLNGRRGKVMGMEPGNGIQVIQATVPLAEVQRYVLDLNAMTAGRGTFTIEPSHYEEVPPNLMDKIIAEASDKQES